MRYLTQCLCAALASSVLLGAPLARAEPIPTTFASQGADRQAISVLLESYTTAVNTRNRALFESLLLDTKVSFSAVPGGPRPDTGSEATRGYDSFAQSVFSGPPFHQDFQDIQILQDGSLASVSLVFVNKAASGQSWGWKTLQLLEVEGHWKIASEFYTGHAKT